MLLLTLMLIFLLTAVYGYFRIRQSLVPGYLLLVSSLGSVTAGFLGRKPGAISGVFAVIVGFYAIVKIEYTR